MYIIKNALRNISRAKVRNILIGIIALVIAISSCIALSIREAAYTAKEDTLSNLAITAQLTYDRSKAMENAMSEADASGGTFNKADMASTFTSNSLSLDELETYAEASTVESFYYSGETYADASGDLVAYGSDSEESADTSSTASTEETNPRTRGGMAEQMSQGDFKLVGYSSDESMTDFLSDGTYSISEGSVFTEGTSDMVCIISDELADYNDLAVGDTITISNPDSTDETYTLEIVGLYTNTASNTSNGMMSMGVDTANYIYMSYNTLQAICDASESVATMTTDDSGNETSTAMTNEVTGTYTFADEDAYNTFAEEVYNMGLSDEYTAYSSEISEYESSLVPLENLSTMATWFLIVVFIIGAIILIVINIFNIRERKYEIGVLTAIGMKKRKVAAQFIIELFIVTMSALIIGAAVGAVASVPVTNTLLASQIESNSESSSSVEGNFGREANAGGGGMQAPGAAPSNSNSSDSSSADADSSSSTDTTTQSSDTGKSFGDKMGNIGASMTDYVSEVSYSTDLKVIIQLLGFGILLTLISSLAGIASIMKYEPLKILSNRG